MVVTDALLEKLAGLARLNFADEEKAQIKSDLQEMIRFVEKLEELDLSGTEPLSHLGGQVNVFREDEVRGTIAREKALQNAPESDSQYFKVPKVLKKR